MKEKNISDTERADEYLEEVSKILDRALQRFVNGAVEEDRVQWIHGEILKFFPENSERIKLEVRLDGYKLSIFPKNLTTTIALSGFVPTNHIPRVLPEEGAIRIRGYPMIFQYTHEQGATIMMDRFVENIQVNFILPGDIACSEAKEEDE